MAVPLKRLHHLTQISLHLDFEKMRGMGGWTQRGICYITMKDVSVQEEMLAAHANSFAHAFKREDYTLRLLGRGSCGGTWFSFHVSKAKVNDSPSAEFNHDDEVRERFSNRGAQRTHSSSLQRVIGDNS